MKYNREKHNRRSIRLKEFDYSQPGAYFLTICAHGGNCIFGDIVDGKIHLNKYGRIVENEWLRSPEIREEIELDMYQVMPNHFHTIVTIVGANGVRRRRNCRNSKGERRSPLQNERKINSESLSSLIYGFKSSTTSKIKKLPINPGVPIWQRNYFEHIIGNDKELYQIREYIINNPLKWELDEEHPQNWITKTDRRNRFCLEDT